MTEGRELERIRLLRGNDVLPLDDPEVAWQVESGALAVFVAWGTPGGPAGRRRFLFEVGPGESLHGVGQATGKRPAIVAVAIEECRLCQTRGGAADADTERFATWCRRWRDAVGFRPATSGVGFHEDLLQHLVSWAGGDERSERDRFQQAERRSREMTREAVGELTSVLAPRARALPPGSELFLAAHLVAQAEGIRLRQAPRWREQAWRGDPVDLIAAASHVRTRRVLLHDGWMRRDCGPLLAFTSDERKPLALLPLKPGKYEVFDPATRKRSALDAELAAGLDPQAHTFYRPLPEEASSGIGLLRFALQGRGRDLLALIGGAAAATLLGMVTPQATALLVDHAIADADVGLIRQLGLALLAAALGAAAFRYAQGVATTRLETSADLLTQSAVWDRLLNLQLSFFRRFSTGDLLSRVTAVSQIRAYLSGTALRTLFSSVAALLNLGLLLYYSPVLTLVALAVAAASAALTVGSGWMILRCYREILELKGRFFGLLVQLIHGVSKLRVAAAEERAFSRWAQAYARLARLELRQRLLQDHVQLGNLALASISTIVLFAVAASLVGRGGMEGALTTGVFLAFSVAFGTFIAAISGLSNTLTDVMAIAILRERARPILEEAAEVNERKADPGSLRGELRIEHVVFQYREEGPVILDGVSLRARPGEFIALVGPSGSGKSTLLRLILGFETAQSGSIFFDGQDLGGLDVFAIRRQLGVVLQQGRINSGSLFENIVCGTQVTLDDAWEAARSTGFADEIETMPMGMHTVISEGGTNLSGGQRQRLLLTRALVHRPRMLLLDEATSALDNRTQAVVSESLARLNVTRIVVAHRLSTIRQANRIYVVESGRVVQRGTFEELSRQDGLFARLMARQMT